MKTKPNILIFVDWFVPGYKAGGPIQSVRNITVALSEYCNFYIVTSNKDFTETIPYSEIIPNKWIDFSNSCKVIYLDDSNQNLKSIQGLILERNYQKFYFNSVFSVKFTILPLLILKRNKLLSNAIVAPRGMLGQGALKIKKYKKRLFLILSKTLGLFSNITWHVSSDLEKQEVIENFGCLTKVEVAPNLPKQSSASYFCQDKVKGELNLFFISRVSEKKNLLGALNLLNKLTSSRIIFDIYGPLEDNEYWTKCEDFMRNLNPSICVTYKGVLKPQDIFETIKKYHFLFLPTFNENYGHVFVESFLSSKPIIISNNTPWVKLKEKNVGWDIPLGDEKQYVEVLKSCLKMEQAEYSAMSESAYKYGKKVSTDISVLKQNIQLFSKT